ncbi:hypothetical protein Hypma_006635 [Hypsizygus marmoreus]|uniref:AB hydrolase-1 domain-containing protein n=1 Tax=Hypsizygus marmoreus TaxID=39966 RepID=A0A369JYL4_HYPMA|nr:hypothetical protein Hypma_006635 [Hypsizygus marmoreus]
MGLFTTRYAQNTTRFHFPENPIDLLVKAQLDPSASERVSLPSLLHARCSSLFAEYRPVWWLNNGHVQTIYNVMGDFSKKDRMWYRRTLLRLLDGGTIGLDFAPSDSTHLAEDTPIIVVQHGLTGGSHEAYLRAILRPACTSIEEGGLGYRAVVVTFRGCAGVPLTSPKLYTAGHTDDLRQALIYISHKYPNAPLLGLGFSLGANVMTRYVAEEGHRSRLSSACVLSCPWNMEQNGHSLVSTFLGKNIWARGMGTNLLKIVKLHQETLRTDAEHPIAQVLPSTLALRYPTLPEFDSTFTKNAGDVAHPFPFSTVDEYYRWASTDHVIEDIRVPFLAINAEDDPVVTICPMDGKGNPYVAMVLTKAGGHLGWFKAGSTSEGTERWTTKPALEWFKLMGEGVVRESSEAARIFVDENGFLREEGRENGLGCKEVGDEVPIDYFDLLLAATLFEIVLIARHKSQRA